MAPIAAPASTLTGVPTPPTAALGRILGLGPNQFVTFAQTVGYPKA